MAFILGLVFVVVGALLAVYFLRKMNDAAFVISLPGYSPVLRGSRVKTYCLLSSVMALGILLGGVTMLVTGDAGDIKFVGLSFVGLLLVRLGMLAVAAFPEKKARKSTKSLPAKTTHAKAAPEKLPAAKKAVTRKTTETRESRR